MNITDKYYYDTAKYERHTSGFYISQSGDIFQENQIADIDTGDHWVRYHWLDSLLNSEDSNSKSLKDVIDLDTYKPEKGSFFAKDKNHVYYLYSISDGTFRFIVDKADPLTFRGIKYKWGKDKNHIYYGLGILKNVDINSFAVIDDSGDSAKDKNHLFYQGEAIN